MARGLWGKLFGDKGYISQPNRIDDQEREVALLARLVEAAADQAALPRQSLERIWPQPPQRLGDTAYQRHATQLVVRDVTLPQAVRFLRGLATGPKPLDIDQLRLSAPRGSAPTAPGITETWTLEASVSYQPEPLNNLALVLERVRRFDESITKYEAALQLQPDNPELVGNLARAKLRRGDPGPEVRELLRKLLLTDTRPEWVQWAEEELVRAESE